MAGEGMDTEDWTRKLRQQAEDSREYRHKLYRKVGLAGKRRILDVGCGTGAVTLDIASSTNGSVVGMDIDPKKLEEARRVLCGFRNIELVEGDAQDLPFDDGTFDLVVFNVVLPYIRDQQLALNEMARVTQKGGHVLATLEPDYAGRIDYPPDPARDAFVASLEDMGADLMVGRKLKALFSRAGLETRLGMETETNYLIMDDEKALANFKNDFWLIEKMLPKHGWTKDRIEDYKRAKIEQISRGEGLCFTPCFYAIGRKP